MERIKIIDEIIETVELIRKEYLRDHYFSMIPEKCNCAIYKLQKLKKILNCSNFWDD